MGNLNRSCDWPQCSCDTQNNEPCRFEDPDFHIRKAERAAAAKPSAAPPPDAARQEAEEVQAALQVGTIDLTPSWSALLPLYLAAIKDGSDIAADAAQSELTRMARLADAYVALKKGS